MNLASPRTETGKRQYSLVLESGYNNMEAVITTTLKGLPLGNRLLNLAPTATRLREADFEYRWLDRFQHRTVVPRSDDRLSSVVWPTLQLHARNDTKVQFQLGENLYKKTVAAGKKDIRMVTFAASLQYGHNLIHTYSGLPALMTSFLKSGVSSPSVCEVVVETDVCWLQS
jgi:hypothetical protein